MVRKFLAVLLIVTLTAEAIFPPTQQPTELPSVIRIEDHCSGFVVSDKHVVTAEHCVEGRSTVWVKFLGGEQRLFAVLRRGKSDDTFQRDWALLVGDASGVEPLQMAGGFNEINTLGMVIGHPFVYPGQFKTIGYIFRKSCDWSGNCQFEVALNAYPGNSGSPFFNYRGEVIGILTGGMRSGNTFVPVNIVTAIDGVVRAMVLDAMENP